MGTVVLSMSFIIANTTWAIVEDFRLIDQNGESHRLHYYTEYDYIIVAHYGDDTVRFLEAVHRANDSNTKVLLISQDRPSYNGPLPVLVDEAMIIGKPIGLTRHDEVVVVRTNDWSTAWTGRSGALYRAFETLLRDGTPAESPAVGRLIRYDDRMVSYSKTVAPILVEKCVKCHRNGGIAPWAMNSYEMIRGFAPMIREVIRTNRMPPWSADPAYGDFVDDQSLSAEQRRSIVKWIESGAQRGKGPDILTDVRVNAPEWQLGEPDLVVDLPPFDVPASGVVEYQYPTVDTALRRDLWVRAVDFVPGNRSVVHHVLVGFYSARALGGGRLGGYVPGTVAKPFPQETGKFLPADSTIVFQIHYTPNGKASTDRSRLGLYFHETAPKHEILGTLLINTRIRIPAGAELHSDSQYRIFDRDVLVYELFPHAHYRGKSIRFDAQYPTGGKETLLSVPAFDFNWQTTYRFREPKVLPAGTKLVLTTTWDNSSRNPSNPDPSQVVFWGRQSWNEMLYGEVLFRYLEE